MSPISSRQKYWEKQRSGYTVKIKRTRNATRNIIFGGILKVYQILVPFLMRTLMTYFMGVQYLGLNSLFTSILHVLNLAELGVGSAMVYSMYKPIAEDDTETICALMRQYRLYYRLIGVFIAIIGLMVTPVVPSLISGEIPSDLNIYILYLLNLAATVFSYWLFAYKNSLLSAHQRTDITSKITIYVNTIQFALQLWAVCILKNYYVYLLIALISQISVNIGTAVITSKKYPKYKPSGRLSSDKSSAINNRIKDLFIAKLGGVVLNSADTIVISTFLGLTVLAIYQNYYFIITSVYGLIEVILTSVTAGIGNSLIVETKEKNYNDMKKFTFMFVWLVGVCTCCFLGLFQPFMKVWMGEKLLLNFSAVICFCIYFFVYELTRLLNIFKNAAGIWHEDRFRPLVSSVVNLSLNLMSVRVLGVYGIILSTVIALCVVELPWLIHNIFSTLFEHSLMKDYLKKLTTYILASIAACILTGILTSLVHLNDWGTFFTCLIICGVVPNLVFFALYYRQREFKESLRMIDKMTKGKLQLEKRFKKYGNNNAEKRNE